MGDERNARRPEMRIGLGARNSLGEFRRESSVNSRRMHAGFFKDAAFEQRILPPPPSAPVASLRCQGVKTNRPGAAGSRSYRAGQSASSSWKAAQIRSRSLEPVAGAAPAQRRFRSVMPSLCASASFRAGIWRRASPSIMAAVAASSASGAAGGSARAGELRPPPAHRPGTPDAFLADKQYVAGRKAEIAILLAARVVNSTSRRLRRRARRGNRRNFRAG